jgi:abequosyltransferase
MCQIIISFCIPTYNFGAFLPRTLESIISQSNDSIEIVIGDGCSNDNTESVVKKYKKIFKNITYKKFSKKGGVDLDLEKTVAMAKGKYCWLFSADDILRQGALDELLKKLHFNPSVLLCNRIDSDFHLNPIAKKSWLNLNKDAVFNLSDKRILLDYLSQAKSLGALFSYISSVIVLRKDWERIDKKLTLYRTNYAHVFKILSICQRNGMLMYINKALINTRLDNDSFVKSGIVKRYLIDFEGYFILFSLLFKDPELLLSVKRVMRRERPWYSLINLANKANSEEWVSIRMLLRYYSYSLFSIYMLSLFRKNKAILDLAWFIKKTIIKIKSLKNSGRRFYV